MLVMLFMTNMHGGNDIIEKVLNLELFLNERKRPLVIKRPLVRKRCCLQGSTSWWRRTWGL